MPVAPILSPIRPGEVGRVFERSPFERHEREHVEGAHPGMYAGVAGQVYLGSAGAGEDYRGFQQRLFSSGQGEDAAVVVGIGVEVEDVDAGYRLHGGGDTFDLRAVAALAEIEDGLEELAHPGPRARSRCTAALMSER